METSERFHAGLPLSWNQRVSSCDLLSVQNGKWWGAHVVPDELLAASFLSYLGSRVPIYIEKPRRTAVFSFSRIRSSFQSYSKKRPSVTPPPLPLSSQTCRSVSFLLCSHLTFVAQNQQKNAGSVLAMPKVFWKIDKCKSSCGAGSTAVLWLWSND